MHNSSFACKMRAICKQNESKTPVSNMHAKCMHLHAKCVPKVSKMQAKRMRAREHAHARQAGLSQNGYGRTLLFPEGSLFANAPLGNQTHTQANKQTNTQVHKHTQTQTNKHTSKTTAAQRQRQHSKGNAAATKAQQRRCSNNGSTAQATQKQQKHSNNSTAATAPAPLRPKRLHLLPRCPLPVCRVSSCRFRLLWSSCPAKYGMVLH